MERQPLRQHEPKPEQRDQWPYGEEALVSGLDRGRGLGRQMAEQLLTFASEHGYLRVRLDTSDKCTDAVALFRKLGFREIDRYKESPTTLFMELRLNGEGG